MDVVEIDVQLFITCRMCLNEPGAFQIVPSIKSQIKFCFDIDIEPFDGLPQLICRKCRATLVEYFDTKTLFLEKQQLLRNKVVKSETNIIQPTKDTSLDEKDEVTAVVPVEKPAAVCIESDLLEHEYNKHFQCKICNKSFLKSSSIKNHVSVHKKIINSHKKAFKKHCVVQLNKVDYDSNCINRRDIVVYNKDKMITNKGTNIYNVLYLPKNFFENRSSEDPDKENFKSGKRSRLSSDSDEDIIIPGKKKRRAFSCSSTHSTVDENKETVVDNNQPVVPVVPLNTTGEPPQSYSKVSSTNSKHVDKMSPDCTTTHKPDSGKRTLQRHHQQPKATNANCKAIQDIVTMCQKKHSKKARCERETVSKPKESSLKHKVLSLGRKLINKRGFECTGLLRYIEQKSLGVTWRPASNAIQNQNKRSDFVRIMTKIKSREDLDNDESGWKDTDKISFRDTLNVPLPPNKVKKEDISCKKISTLVTENNGKISPPPPNNSHLKDETTNILRESKVKDLNNENKMPKASSVIKNKKLSIKKTKSPCDAKSTALKVNVVDTSQPADVSVKNDDTDKGGSQLCMPIITETLSLLEDDDDRVQENQIVDKPPPRIKVKPVSELMSERALMNQDTSKMWGSHADYTDLPCETSKPRHLPLSSASIATTISNTLPSDNGITTTDNEIRGNTVDDPFEYVILHTLELPNSKTKSPFQYFKTILLYHGLTLMDLNEELPPNFYCLIKFKLQLKQDSKKPLGILLSLFCSNENFCFKFRDTNSRIFDPHQLSAFWQWELLKIYQGQVVNKVLQNAIKISKEVYEYTKKFLCLLKSIECVIESK